MYNEGISIAGDILDIGVPTGVIQKSGNNYHFKETKLGLGRESAKTFLNENKPMMMDIRNEIIAAVAGGKELEE